MQWPPLIIVETSPIHHLHHHLLISHGLRAHLGNLHLLNPLVLFRIILLLCNIVPFTA